MSFSQSAVNQRSFPNHPHRQSKTVEYHLPSRASIQEYQALLDHHAVEAAKSTAFIPSRQAPAPPLQTTHRSRIPTESSPAPPVSAPPPAKIRNSLQKPNPRARKHSLTSVSPSPRIVEHDPFAANANDNPLTQHLKSQKSGSMATGTSPPPRPSRANTANLNDIIPNPSQLAARRLSQPSTPMFDDGHFYADPQESLPSGPSQDYSPSAPVGTNSRIRSRSGTTSKAKKGVLGLMSEMFNPTKRPEISTPYDPVHLTHVGFNSSTGEFTGLPKEWQQLLQESGISRSEQEKNPQAVMEIVKFYQEGHGDVWDKLGNVGPTQELSFLQPRVDESFQNPVGNQDLMLSLYIYSVLSALHHHPRKNNHRRHLTLLLPLPLRIARHLHHLPRLHLLWTVQLLSVLPQRQANQQILGVQTPRVTGDPLRQRKYLVAKALLRNRNLSQPNHRLFHHLQIFH